MRVPESMQAVEVLPSPARWEGLVSSADPGWAVARTAASGGGGRDRRMVSPALGAGEEGGCGGRVRHRARLWGGVVTGGKGGPRRRPAEAAHRVCDGGPAAPRR